MKLFIASGFPKGFISQNYYNNCIEGELLRFSAEQNFTFHSGSDIIDMVGIESLKKTTEIQVKDISIDFDYYCELLAESFLRDFPKGILKNDRLTISDEGISYQFDISDLAELLIDKANSFEIGDDIIIKGKIFKRR